MQDFANTSNDKVKENQNRFNQSQSQSVNMFFLEQQFQISFFLTVIF